MTDDEQNHLNRDWIDWTLARDLIATIRQRTEGNPIALGVGLATYAVCVVTAIRSMRPEHQLVVVDEMFQFLTDLYNEGWTAPPEDKGKMQ